MIYCAKRQHLTTKNAKHKTYKCCYYCKLKTKSQVLIKVCPNGIFCIDFIGIKQRTLKPVQQTDITMAKFEEWMNF